MSRGELIQLRTALQELCESEEQLIQDYPHIFCDRDFDRIKSLLQFMKEL